MPANKAIQRMCAGFGVGNGMHQPMPRQFKFRPNRDVDGNGRTNGVRADRAMQAVEAWLGEDRPDDAPDTHIQDLLCDLHHLCDREGLNLDQLFAEGKSCYMDER